MKYLSVISSSSKSFLTFFTAAAVKKVKKDFDELEITLKYFNDQPVIKELVRESKPGLRQYISYKDIKPHKRGLGIKVLTTSKGLMTDRQAIKSEMGGEIICRVF